MLSLLVHAYRANPVRPHCSPARHVWLCRVINPFLPPHLGCPDLDRKWV